MFATIWPTQAGNHSQGLTSLLLGCFSSVQIKFYDWQRIKFLVMADSALQCAEACNPRRHWMCHLTQQCAATNDFLCNCCGDNRACLCGWASTRSRPRHLMKPASLDTSLRCYNHFMLCGVRRGEIKGKFPSRITFISETKGVSVKAIFRSRQTAHLFPLQIRMKTAF